MLKMQLTNKPTLASTIGVGFFGALPHSWQGLTSLPAGQRSLQVSLEKYYRASSETVSRVIWAKGLCCLCTMQAPMF
jgi:hypothetical protein